MADVLVLRLLLLLGYQTALLERSEVTAALETNGRDETLDFRAEKYTIRYYFR